eukprot:TRINITY_DN16438_c0_g1_i1.p1 TRINITY_DN16438_c0_g1~~TRINITY_DN16438_c0_g1_i1.p1  ORF type:complete len:728 (+),score=252.05 TRINITY_DN16438_c0_g1_i1:68-2251(+)
MRRCAVLLVQTGSPQMKDALTRLFLKIHPDLHFGSPERSRSNEVALQDLNAVMAWERQLRKGHIAPPPPVHRIAFYDRHYEREPETSERAVAATRVKAEAPPDGPGIISATLDFPQAWFKRLPPGEVAQASLKLNGFLRNLLTSAGVLSEAEQATLRTASQDAEKQFERTQQKLKEETERRSDRFKRLRQDPNLGDVRLSDVTRQYRSAPWATSQKEVRIKLRTDPMGDFGAAFDAADMEVPDGAHEQASPPSGIERQHRVKVPRSKAEADELQKQRTQQKKDRGSLDHLADQFEKLMQEHWSPLEVPEVTELIASDLVHYDKELSPVDCAMAVDTLHGELRNMRYDLWYLLPVFITTHYGVSTDIDGFISIPYNFTVPDFLQFLDRQRGALRALQQRAAGTATEFEGTLRKAKEGVPLSDIVVRCPHADALPALQILGTEECTTIMRDGRWNDMVVEVIPAGSQYGARESGVLQVPCDLDVQGMREFCEYLVVNDQIEPLREAYEQALNQLEEMQKLQTICEHVITPASFDLDSSGATVEEKLMWLRELYSISGMLSRYDWTEYDFVLGPLDLDWQGGVLTLPPDFHGHNLAQTIDLLHEEDMKAVGENEPSSEEDFMLQMEAKRIRRELQSSGLLEMDPEKQTESQRKLWQMVQNYGDPGQVAEFVRAQFPGHKEQIEENAATAQELVSQLRMNQGGFMATRLRQYYKNKMRPRVGPNRFQWEHH